MSNLITTNAVPILLVLFLVSLVTFFFVNRQAVIYRRRFLRPVFIINGALLVVLVVVWLGRLGYSFSDSEAIVGLLITFLFGIWGTDYLKKRQEALVVLVIPSRAAFIEEIRKAIFRNLGDAPIRLFDLFTSPENQHLFEDLASFIPLAQTSEALHPDYLVLLPHSKEQTNSPELKGVITRLKNRGGRTIIFQNPPEDIMDYEGAVTCIYSDSTEGARVLAEYAVTILAEGSVILLLCGPTYSPPAQIRKQIFLEVLKDTKFDLVVHDIPGWSEEGTYLRTSVYLQGNPAPDLIICGNDVMARGAIKALREFTEGKPTATKVFGYDGLTQALILIADKHNPFYATIRIPPSSYGRIAIGMIKAEANGALKPNPAEIMQRIIIDGTNLVTKENVDRFLENI